MLDMDPWTSFSPPQMLRGRLKRRIHRHARLASPLIHTTTPKNLASSKEHQTHSVRGRSRRFLKRQINLGCTEAAMLLGIPRLTNAANIETEPFYSPPQSAGRTSTTDSLRTWLMESSLEHPEESISVMRRMENRLCEKELFLTLPLLDSIHFLGMELHMVDERVSPLRIPKSEKAAEILDMMCAEYQSIRVGPGASLRLPECASIVRMDALFESGSIKTVTDYMVLAASQSEDAVPGMVEYLLGILDSRNLNRVLEEVVQANTNTSGSPVAESILRLYPEFVATETLVAQAVRSEEFFHSEGESFCLKLLARCPNGTASPLILTAAIEVKHWDVAKAFIGRPRVTLTNINASRAIRKTHYKFSNEGILSLFLQVNPKISLDEPSLVEILTFGPERLRFLTDIGDPANITQTVLELAAAKTECNVFLRLLRKANVGLTSEVLVAAATNTEHGNRIFKSIRPPVSALPLTSEFLELAIMNLSIARISKIFDHFAPVQLRRGLILAVFQCQKAAVEKLKLLLTKTKFAENGLDESFWSAAVALEHPESLQLFAVLLESYNLVVTDSILMSATRTEDPIRTLEFLLEKDPKYRTTSETLLALSMEGLDTLKYHVNGIANILMTRWSGPDPPNFLIAVGLFHRGLLTQLLETHSQPDKIVLTEHDFLLGLRICTRRSRINDLDGVFSTNQICTMMKNNSLKILLERGCHLEVTERVIEEIARSFTPKIMEQILKSHPDIQVTDAMIFASLEGFDSMCDILLQQHSGPLSPAVVHAVWGDKLERIASTIGGMVVLKICEKSLLPVAKRLVEQTSPLCSLCFQKAMAEIMNHVWRGSEGSLAFGAIELVANAFPDTALEEIFFSNLRDPELRDEAIYDASETAIQFGIPLESRIAYMWRVYRHRDDRVLKAWEVLIASKATIIWTDDAQETVFKLYNLPVLRGLVRYWDPFAEVAEKLVLASLRGRDEPVAKLEFLWTKVPELLATDEMVEEAVRNNRLAAMEFLLEKGANLEVTESLLSIALEYKHDSSAAITFRETARFLLEIAPDLRPSEELVRAAFQRALPSTAMLFLQRRKGNPLSDDTVYAIMEQTTSSTRARQISEAAGELSIFARPGVVSRALRAGMLEELRSVFDIDVGRCQLQSCLTLDTGQVLLPDLLRVLSKIGNSCLTAHAISEVWSSLGYFLPKQMLLEAANVTLGLETFRNLPRRRLVSLPLLNFQVDREIILEAEKEGNDRKKFDFILSTHSRILVAESALHEAARQSEIVWFSRLLSLAIGQKLVFVDLEGLLTASLEGMVPSIIQRCAELQTGGS